MFWWTFYWYMESFVFLEVARRWDSLLALFPNQPLHGNLKFGMVYKNQTMHCLTAKLQLTSHLSTYNYINILDMQPAFMRTQNNYQIWACITSYRYIQCFSKCSFYDEWWQFSTAQFTFQYCTHYVALSLHFSAAITPYYRHWF